jgi:GTPase SAR1 family protein
LDRIGKADYIPEIKDILRVREPTTAIIEHKFKIKDTDFLFVDVGGQKSERRKWISCFESVSNIMFVASLSDYDLHLTNDELRGFKNEGNKQVNRLKEALDLFRTTINLGKPIFYSIKDTNGKEIQRKREELLFKNVGIILFLNKKDLFDEKILHSPLKTCFSEFDDQKYREDVRADAAKEFIAKKFTNFVEQDRNFYCHFTYALDRESMAVVIEAVRTQILENVLRNLML